jgi:co-chaperonin GroES (HSP10)
MTIYGQGAPGTRIRLRDLSEVSLVTDPNIVGGTIGFSTRGEFNKIIRLTSSSDMDVYLGGGFNNSKYNQALYGARAVLDNGGFMEFVRLYGEAIEDDDTVEDYDFNQKLKTDTFLVQYDFAADADVSFDIDFYASTRYIQDGLANIGEREIYTISEVITKNTNVNFVIDSDETETDKIPLFAIMNSDPTAAARAGTKYEIDTIIEVPDPYNHVVTVKTINDNILAVGDLITIGGTVNFNTSAPVAVETVTDKKTFTYFSVDEVYASESVGAVYLNEDTIESGIDSIIVKTVSAGQASKKFDYVTLNYVGATDVYTLPGKVLNVNMPDGSDVDFEFVESGVTPTAGNIAVSIIYSEFADTDVTAPASFAVTNPGSFAVGDVVQLAYDGGSYTIDGGVSPFTDYIVNTKNGNVLTLNKVMGAALDMVYGADVYDGYKIVNITGTLNSLKTAMIAADDSGTISSVPVRGIFNGVSDINVGSPTDTITVNDISKFAVDDLVKFSNICSRRGNADCAGPGVYYAGVLPTDNATSEPIDSTVIYKVTSVTATSNGRGEIKLKVEETGVPLLISEDANTSNDYTQVISGIDTGTEEITVSNAYKFQVGDKVLYTAGAGTIVGLSDGTTYIVSEITSSTKIILTGVNLTGGSPAGDTTLKNVTAIEESNYRITNLTKSNGGSIAVDTGALGRQLNYIGVYGLRYPTTVQDNSFFDDTECTPEITNAPAIVDIDETDDGIVIDSTMGRIFESLGLAERSYIDTNFDFHNEAQYTLTEDGEAVAKIYLYVEYIFNGETYKFSGTIIPFTSGDSNLYIVDAADSVANGWKFVINENAALEAAVADPLFNFAQSVNMGLIEDEFSDVSFNPEDPAVLNDAIWEYDPKYNNTSAIKSSGWDLFLNKDASYADMLVAAGTAITNLFVRGMETIDYTVMNNMLDVCEKRKDMYAIFDGVDEPKIDTALEKMGSVGSQGDVSRWGGIFDGRSIFFDNIYTKLSVELVKSIEVAAIITTNRAGGIWWLPPAGYQTGRVPGFVARQKILRTYNYADDPNSDIARLYDANINPTRSNDQGMVIYGQKTMLKRSTALNRLNVIMLIAGIHKRFANYLDNKVFQLNTPSLRSNIQAELQTQIDMIKSTNPAGVTAGVVICDATNNTPTIIDTNQLIVDVVIQPSRTAEFITLRTTVQRTGENLSVTETTIIGG